MLDLTRDINSLSEFKRKTPQFLRQMKDTGKPLVLTVNGKAEIIVQDAASYQKLLEEIQRLQSVEAIRRGLQDVQEGRTVSLEAFDKEMRAKYGIPR